MCPRVEFEGSSYDLLPGETVLAGLARHGVELPSFCRTGVCQTCLVRATRGSPPPNSQAGVAASWAERGCFLACQCVPEGPLALERSDVFGTFGSRVLRVEELTPRVLRVQLEVPQGFEYRGGQFLQLERAGGVMRPYSIASLPGTAYLELHVALLAGGAMSQWLRTATAQPVTLRGPFGECFYLEREPERPLLLAGTGTGLAPLLAVTRAALAAGHRAPIHLYHGSTSIEDLYLWRELAELVESAPQLRVWGSVLPTLAATQPTRPATQPTLTATQPTRAATQPTAAELQSAAAAASASRCQVLQQPLDRLILDDPLDCFDCRVYLCGDPGLVQRLRQRVYLCGTPFARIHCDPFVAPPPG
jgi:CDP-4-dehydro-6-deoxyglucose reductase